MNRNRSLDILRFIAVFLVFGSHLQHYKLWSRCGWVGVDLFFVLSGFLISGLLFEEFKRTGSIRYGRFILRRGLKIWPAFYFLVATMALLMMNYRPYPTSGFAVQLVFLQNYLGLPGPRYIHVLGHTWSLAIEEHFYLALPFLLIVLAKFRSSDPFRPILFLMPVVAALCLWFRILEHHTARIEILTHLRIDSLFAGVALGYVYHFRSALFEKLTNTSLLPVAAICIAPALIFDGFSEQMQTWGLTLLLVGFSILVAWSVRRSANWPGAAVLAKVGTFSYSIYLWHYFIALLFQSRAASAAWFWVYVVVATLVGIGAAKLIEIPILRIRNRWIPSEVVPLYDAPLAKASRFAFATSVRMRL